MPQDCLIFVNVTTDATWEGTLPAFCFLGATNQFVESEGTVMYCISICTCARLCIVQNGLRTPKPKAHIDPRF